MRHAFPHELLGENDGAGPPDGLGQGPIVARHPGLVEHHVEDDGRRAAAMEGVDEVGVLGARPSVRIGRQAERLGRRPVDGDDEDLGRWRARAAEPEEKTESDRFLQGHAKRQGHEEEAGDGGERADAEGPAEHAPQAVAAPSRLGRFSHPPDGVRGAGIGLPAASRRLVRSTAMRHWRRRVARVARV